MKYLILLISLLTCFSATTKGQDKKLVQFSGIIYNSDTVNAVVPYVTIVNKSHKNQAFYANYQGYFSFVADEQDTIIFNSIGYRREALVIPANLPDKKYTVLVKMKPEAISLPVVKVYPWASIDEFNREFMTLKFADDDLEIAKKNVSKDKLIAMAKTLPRDGQEMSTINFQNNHIALSNKNINQRGANPLLNPFAWGALMQQIFQGDKSRNESN